VDDVATLAPVLTPLLQHAGFAETFTLQPLASGNNRVFRLEAGGQAALLKVYFQHAEDARDRLGAEYAFSVFAWQQGLRQLPRPLACDRKHAIALYEFISGRSLAADEVVWSLVDKALAFCLELNRPRSCADARALAPASEACFTLADHLACIERRVQRLQQIPMTSAPDASARAFAETQVAPVWERLRGHAECGAAASALPLDLPLADGERCLSPSDFGFHNAVVAQDAELRFVDFEYAGWDDPAKLVCDFFCQPAVPVPVCFLSRFLDRIASGLGAQTLPKRVHLLFPLYQLKWVCILLNEFLPVGSCQRVFAQPGVRREGRKLEQLTKARRMLAAVTTNF